jgi:methyltransferase (TIGR00027 family)
MRRAAHQVLDAPPVFADPLACRILGGDVQTAVEFAINTPSLRAYLSARSRLAEDTIDEAVEGGVRQLVILGAGLDTFAYRNPYPDLQVFEVDLHAAQQFKRERLGLSQISIPPNVTFVPVDFEDDGWATELERAGLDRRRSAVYSCLGVTPYLTRVAFNRVVDFIALFPRGTALVFDYALLAAHLSGEGRSAHERMLGRITAAGEPYRLFFESEEVSGYLQSCGFDRIEDLDADELDRLYFADRTDGLRIGGAMGRLLRTWVG